MDAADHKTLKKDDSRWERGDWEHDPKEDPDWNDPSLLRRRIGTREELEAVADAIVRGYEIRDTDPEGNDRPIVADFDGFETRNLQTAAMRGICGNVIVEDLQALIEAVQRHPDVRLARFEGKENEERGFRVTRRWVTDRNGRELIEESASTSLAMIGCLVESVDFRVGPAGLDIGIRLTAVARFNEMAIFGSARFAAPADFGLARFSNKVFFGSVRFGGNTSFRNSCFASEADFWQARFVGDANFIGVRFSADAVFSDTHFAASADFRNGGFFGCAVLDGVRFDGDVWFGNARFQREADFSRTRFGGAVGFLGARFCQSLDFGDAKFSASAEVSGDLRDADIRDASIVRPRRDRQAERLPFLRRQWNMLVHWSLVLADFSHQLTRGFGWTVFRPICEMSQPTRIAGAVIVTVVGLGPFAAGKIAREVDAIRGLIEGWQNQSDPLPVAVTFFAAIFVMLGQVMYWIGVPSAIRKQDQDDFVQSKQQAYTDDKNQVVRRDLLREACEGLEVAAVKDRFRNANLITRHGHVVWIPPRNRIEWFEDSERFKAEPVPEWYVRGEERARIAIEEGARARYWFESRKHLSAATLCALLYLLGVVLVLVVLGLQAANIWNAAGLPWF